MVASTVASRWEMYEDASAYTLSKTNAWRSLGSELKGLLHSWVMDEDVDLPVLLKSCKKY